MCLLVLLHDLVLLLFICCRRHSQSAIGTRVGLDRRKLLRLLVLVAGIGLDSIADGVVLEVLFVEIVVLAASIQLIFNLIWAVTATWR